MPRIGILVFRIAAPLLVSLLWCATLAAAPPGYSAYSGKPPIVVSTDGVRRTAKLDIVGSENLAALGFNFNGYADGDMIVRVPAVLVK